MITVGVSSYNGAWRLNNLLRSLWLRTPELERGEARVVVVDDGTPNVQPVRDVIAEWRTKMPLDFIEHGTNRGISAGWNTASRAVPDARIVILLNDDVIVSSAALPGISWLAPLVYMLDNSPGVGVVGPNWHAFTGDDVASLLADRDSDKAVVPRDPVSKAQRPDRRDLEPCDPGRVMAPGGQLFAFRKEDYEAVGGFDEGFKSFFEESSFGTAMAADLRKIGVGLNWPQCWHMWSATFQSNPNLEADERMRVSRTHYYNRWKVPGHYGNPFDYTNPTHLGSCPDVPIKFLRGTNGEKWKAILRQDGACIEQQKDEP